MRAIVTRLTPEKRREKALVTDWPDLEVSNGNQVKTQTIYTGITNGTERNGLLGGNYASKDEDLPNIYGYQNVGKVVEVGPDVKDLKIGDVLYTSSYHTEYAVMPEDGLLIVLPPEVDHKHAALFGMASVAMRSCRNADLRMGERLLVVGLGFVGQMAAQIANVMGARVTACDVDPRRIEIAREINGAEEVCDVSGEGWERKIGEGVFDAVIDLAGVPDMEDRLISAVRRRGRVIFVAGRFKVSYTFNTGQNREITIKQNGHFDRDDLANLCHLVSRDMVKIGPLISNVVSVNEANRIYNTLRDNPSELLGTVFEW